MSNPTLSSKTGVAVWVIVWRTSRGDWFPWDFVRARIHRNELFQDLRGLRLKYPKDTFRLRKFVMVNP